MKKNWIEITRVMATLAVVFLHISMTVITNNTISEMNGINNFIILDICQLISRWAVPCFIMITGALLLDPNKEIDAKKILKYIIRIAIVLVTFGTFYAFLELFFEKRTINLEIIFTSILNVLQGNTWSHMWYLYTLIGLYIITPIIRIIIKKLSEKELFDLIITLFIGTILINTINYLFNLNIENYMLISVYILYYITGYYMITLNNKFSFKGLKKYIAVIIPIICMIFIDVFNIIKYEKNLEWIIGLDNIFVYVYSIGMFSLIKQKYENKAEISSFIKFFSKYSFSIYVIHPFWINLIYKVLKITPLDFPIFGGILCMFFLVLLLTLISTIIIKKMPFIKNYI